MNEVDKTYFDDLNKIKETIRNNQNKAMVVVNSAMIMTYYEIGTIINQRKNWGSKYIQKLSEDLKDYERGYSFDNLRKMAQFALIFSKDEIWLQPVTKIPWGTIIQIMYKSKSHEEMLWYINKTYKNSWSRSTVLKQFEAKAYERGIIEPSTTPSREKPKTFVRHFRIYFKSNHPAYIIDEDGNKYIFHRVTSSEKSGHKKNWIVYPNPDSKKKTPMYIVKTEQIDFKKRFGKKLKYNAKLDFIKRKKSD